MELYNVGHRFLLISLFICCFPCRTTFFHFIAPIAFARGLFLASDHSPNRINLRLLFVKWIQSRIILIFKYACNMRSILKFKYLSLHMMSVDFSLPYFLCFRYLTDGQPWTYPINKWLGSLFFHAWRLLAVICVSEKYPPKLVYPIWGFSSYRVFFFLTWFCDDSTTIIGKVEKIIFQIFYGRPASASHWLDSIHIHIRWQVFTFVLVHSFACLSLCCRCWMPRCAGKWVVCLPE